MEKVIFQPSWVLAAAGVRGHQLQFVPHRVDELLPAVAQGGDGGQQLGHAGGIHPFLTGLAVQKLSGTDVEHHGSRRGDRGVHGRIRSRPGGGSGGSRRGFSRLGGNGGLGDRGRGLRPRGGGAGEHLQQENQQGHQQQQNQYASRRHQPPSTGVLPAAMDAFFLRHDCDSFPKKCLLMISIPPKATDYRYRLGLFFL